jgi:cyclophilin family peptidyl-prolyl cis-trans isomerase
MKPRIYGISLLSLAVAGIACCQDPKEPAPADPPAEPAPAAQAGPRVALETTHGTIVIELDEKAAPESVKNFLKYVDDGYYDGTIFHRVIGNFMIQGGGFELKDGVGTQKETNPPIKNEAKNGLKNLRGTLAMARTNDPDSATSQFFINSVDNGGGLDSGKTGDGVGYTVFGKVVEGMDVVDKISAVKTTSVAGNRDVPVDAVVIESAKRE